MSGTKSENELDVEHQQSPLLNSNTRQLRNRTVKSAQKNENEKTKMSARKSMAVHHKINDDQDENLKTPRIRKTMPSSSSYKKTDNKLVDHLLKRTDTAVTTPVKHSVYSHQTPLIKSTRKRQTTTSAIKKTPRKKTTYNEENQSNRSNNQETNMTVVEQPINDKKISEKNIDKKTKRQTICSTSKNEEQDKSIIDSNSFTITTESNNETKNPVVDEPTINVPEIVIVDDSSFTISNESTKEQNILTVAEENKVLQEPAGISIDKIQVNDKKLDIVENQQNIVDNTSFTISTEPAGLTESSEQVQNNSSVVQSEMESIATEIVDEIHTDEIHQSESILNKTNEIHNKVPENNCNEIETDQQTSIKSEQEPNKLTITAVDTINVENNITPLIIDENEITPLIIDDDINENQKTISLDIEIFQINTSLTPLGPNSNNEIAEIAPISGKKSIVDLTDEPFNESGIILIPDTPPVIKSESRFLNETFSPVPKETNDRQQRATVAVSSPSSTSAAAAAASSAAASTAAASTAAASTAASCLNTTFSPESPKPTTLSNIVKNTNKLTGPPQSEIKLTINRKNTSTPRSPHIKRQISIKTTPMVQNSATKPKAIKSLSISRREQTPFKHKSGLFSSIGQVKTKIDLINSTLGLTSNLKTTRKRSMSVDGGIGGVGAPITESTKKNIRVTFHSPLNNEISIQQIDQIMEESRRECQQSAGAGGGGGGGVAIGGGRTNLRRKRSLSSNDISHIRDANEKVKKSSGKSSRLPDFASIHQKNFERMESIMDYAQRKDERSKMLRSGQKSQTKEEVKNNKSSTMNKPDAQKSLFNVATTISESATTSESLSKLAKTRNDKPFTFVASNCLPIPTKIPIQSNASSSRVGSNAKSARNHKEMFKGKIPKTNATGENNKILKGVRTNRRFDLLMKFRQDSEDIN